MRATVLVRPKQGILDPQGEAVASALGHLGFSVSTARVGKVIDLEVDAPDERGPMLRGLAGREIQTVSPGTLFGRCMISADRLGAHCAIGRGEAVVVADADFLNLAGMDGPIDDNLPALLGELERLDGPAN